MILECMYQLAEKKVSVRCRKADKEKVSNAAKKASEEYKKQMGGESQVVIDEKDWLPEDSYVPWIRECVVRTDMCETGLEVSSCSTVTARSN